MISPRVASFTVIEEQEFKRRAKGAVKPDGICWTMRMGTGKSAENFGRICSRTLGPPVDNPMAITAGACTSGWMNESSEEESDDLLYPRNLAQV
jgi:hypothetical protein